MKISRVQGYHKNTYFAPLTPPLRYAFNYITVFFFEGIIYNISQSLKLHLFDMS